MLPRTLEPEVMDEPGEAMSYARMDHAAANAAFVERLVSLGAHGHLLDLGTGPGDIAVLIAERLSGVQITACDLAEPMLDLARRRVAERGLDRRVTLARADVKDLPYPKASFTTVYCNTVLHHLPDPAAMLREARRVLDTRGVLLIRDLFRPESEADIERLVESHGGDAEHPRQMLRQSFHAALTADELRQLAADTGWHDAEVIVDSDRHLSLQRAAR